MSREKDHEEDLKDAGPATGEEDITETERVDEALDEGFRRFRDAHWTTHLALEGRHAPVRYSTGYDGDSGIQYSRSRY